MNFWCTSESTSDVSRLFFADRQSIGAIKLLEQRVNHHLDGIETGIWRQWCVIFIIVSDDMIRNLKFRETRRLTRKDMTLDFRIFVDHEQSKLPDLITCIDLLVPALERTLPYFEKAGIKKETQDRIRDSVRLAAEEVKSSHASSTSVSIKLPFQSNLKSYVCNHVFNHERPVLYVSRDRGDWIFLCGDFHPEEACSYKVVGIGHLIDQILPYWRFWIYALNRKQSVETFEAIGFERGEYRTRDIFFVSDILIFIWY